MSIKLTEWDRIAAIWNAEAADEGIWHQRNDIDPVIFKILSKVNGQKIIEIGCGNGYFARKLSIKGAKERLKPLLIKYLVRDASNLYGLKSKSFDIAVANMSLMDIADKVQLSPEITITNYHHSIETYFQFLFNSGFLIKEFREITTKKKVTKATKKHEEVTLRRSKYTTISEKKMKELAGEELPFFLIVEALKVN